MVEKDTVFSTKIKYKGIVKFEDYYRFCYDWLIDETKLDVSEKKYKEKIAGDAKGIEIEWDGVRKVTDYFQFNVQVTFRVVGLTNVEITQNGKKVKTNSGTVEMGVKGILIKDYQGKFDKTAFQKFLRAVYEKWIIPARIDEFETKLITDCDEFLNQAKAFLDLEGKK